MSCRAGNISSLDVDFCDVIPRNTGYRRYDVYSGECDISDISPVFPTLGKTDGLRLRFVPSIGKFAEEYLWNVDEASSLVGM